MRVAGLLACALALAPAPQVRAAAADAIPVRLLDGRTIHASRVERAGDVVVLRVSGATLRVRAGDVVSIGAPHSAGDRATGGALNLPVDAAGGNDAPDAPDAPPPDAASGAWRIGATARSEDQLRQALITNMDDAASRLALGGLLLASGRLTEAVQELRRVPFAASPSLRRETALALADALTRLDRPGDALVALDGIPPDETIARVREAIARDAEHGSSDVSSTHFVVHAPAGTDRRLLAPLVTELEAAHDEIRAKLGATTVERIVVLLYPGDEFWEATGQGRGVGGLYDGKVRVPAGRIHPPSPRLREVLRHEVAHAFVEEISAGRADAAWQEGIAEHFEGDDVSSLEKGLRETARDPARWPPPQSHETAHVRVEWFLRRFGMSALAATLAAMPGKGIDGALRGVTGLDSAQLDEAWRRDLLGARD